MKLHDCFKTGPTKHPWIAGVDDAPCMYDRKDGDARCVGCYLSTRKAQVPTEFEVTPDLLRVQVSWGQRNEAARELLRR